jgi:hypothetical protein
MLSYSSEAMLSCLASSYCLFISRSSSFSFYAFSSLSLFSFSSFSFSYRFISAIRLSSYTLLKLL